MEANNNQQLTVTEFLAQKNSTDRHSSSSTTSSTSTAPGKLGDGPKSAKSSAFQHENRHIDTNINSDNTTTNLHHHHQTKMDDSTANSVSILPSTSSFSRRLLLLSSSREAVSASSSSSSSAEKEKEADTILLHIFSFFGPDDLHTLCFNLMLSCKRFYAVLISCDRVWAPILESMFAAIQQQKRKEAEGFEKYPERLTKRKATAMPNFDEAPKLILNTKEIVGLLRGEATEGEGDDAHNNANKSPLQKKTQQQATPDAAVVTTTPLAKALAARIEGGICLAPFHLAATAAAATSVVAQNTVPTSAVATSEEEEAKDSTTVLDTTTTTTLSSPKPSPTFLALKAAYRDSKRCIITMEELCARRYNIKFRSFVTLELLPPQPPSDDVPYLYCQFYPDSTVRTEGLVPGSTHPMCDFLSNWEFVPAMRSLQSYDGGDTFQVVGDAASDNATGGDAAAIAGPASTADSVSSQQLRMDTSATDDQSKMLADFTPPSSTNSRGRGGGGGNNNNNSATPIPTSSMFMASSRPTTMTPNTPLRAPLPVPGNESTGSSSVTPTTISSSSSPSCYPWTCLHWYGRPPLRLSRHPKNWHIILSSFNTIYCSMPMPKNGTDAFFDDFEPYVHPWNFAQFQETIAPPDDDEEDDA